MGITHTPTRRERGAQETLIMPLKWGSMFYSNEAPLSAGTYPKVPAYDTVENADFDCTTQTGTGSLSDIWWTIITLPKRYIDATNLTVKIDSKYTLSGTPTVNASTIDIEAFPYDSTNGDFSNADVCATTAQALAATYATESFTITGTTLTSLTQVLLRFTSAVDITQDGGGTDSILNSFNFPRVEYTGIE